MSDGRADPAGWAGVLGVVLPVAALAALPIWDFPGTDASGAEVLEFATRHQSALQLVMVLNTTGVVLWTVLGAGVLVRLLTDRAEPLAAACFGVGVLGLTTLLLAGFTAFEVLVYRAPDVRDPRMLYDLTFGLLAMSGPPTAVAMTAYATHVYRRRTLPLHTAHLAALTAVAHVALLASLVVPRGPWSLEAAPLTVAPAFLFAWIADAGVVLLSSRAGPRTPSWCRGTTPSP